MSKKLGDISENIAKRELEDLGHRILARNFHSRFGEIDIISICQEKILHFVEVKSRRSYGSPEEAVEFLKISKIKKTINIWLNINKVYFESLQIDVCAISWDNSKYSIDWFWDVYIANN